MISGRVTYPLKMDGWNTILSYWGVKAYFQGLLLLVSGRVVEIPLFIRFLKHPRWLGMDPIDQKAGSTFKITPAKV